MQYVKNMAVFVLGLLPALVLAEESDRMPMMDGMVSGMGIFMMIFMALLILFLVLGILALIKYLLGK